MKKNIYLIFKVLAIELNISVTTLRRWLNNYRSEEFSKFLEKERRILAYSIIIPKIN